MEGPSDVVTLSTAPSIVGSAQPSSDLPMAPNSTVLADNLSHHEGDVFPADIFADGTLLGLSHENLVFLDQVFMEGGIGSTEWLGQEMVASQDAQAHNPTDAQPNDNDMQAPDAADINQQYPWLNSFDNSATFINLALHCYFQFAAPWLPVILEDAFWHDYRRNLCSRALVSAIACRGMPFTTLSNKWDLQQRFACEFREAFLETQSATSNENTVRVDDLEALALMANFEYTDTGNPPLLSNLGRLFLKHESLVMMLLHYRVTDRSCAEAHSTVTVSRGPERRMLLYWHVYGLDAFQCLDRKQISLISNKDAGDTSRFPRLEASDFADAVLELAVVSRSLMRRLGNNSAKRRGIEAQDVHDVYALIDRWRAHTCPPHLRRQNTDPGTVSPQSSSEDQREPQPDKYIHLHRAVLWALEINCLMHVECLVAEYGLHKSGTLVAEMTMTRVEYESLRALHDMVAICHWIDLHAIRDEDGVHHSLVDLAPLALRNVCAGLCSWTCQRGINAAELSKARRHVESSRPGTRAQKHPVYAYLSDMRLLRDTAAKATSHRDTTALIERMDGQIAMLTAQAG
ncbi:hypothetical protein N7539_007089 [Penicillium diatomitis]|uniref:Transcription factor domain-containing protein n=1 Tax=Penicillium diatomitis TaxID=2819901 RepID=A0A9X0BNJ6_9EURO|nr:uncharacterized protein N7539_007089 [Penicillium diatomitis]KAJ5476945.1 hypothetical protein N7539_007089 [Penicillium diatomitis]